MVDAWWVSVFEIVDKGQPFDFLSFELSDAAPNGLDADEDLGACASNRFLEAMHSHFTALALRVVSVEEQWGQGAGFIPTKS